MSDLELKPWEKADHHSGQLGGEEVGGLPSCSDHQNISHQISFSSENRVLSSELHSLFSTALERTLERKPGRTPDYVKAIRRADDILLQVWGTAPSIVDLCTSSAIEVVGAHFSVPKEKSRAFRAPSVASLSWKVGTRLQAELLSVWLGQEAPGLLGDRRLGLDLDPTKPGFRCSQLQGLATELRAPAVWDVNQVCLVGHFLVRLLEHEGFLCPYFSAEENKETKNYPPARVRPTTAFEQALSEMRTTGALEATRGLLTEPPLPWTSLTEGGHPLASSHLINARRDREGDLIEGLATSGSGGLDLLLKGINHLQRYPWQVNQEIAEVFEVDIDRSVPTYFVWGADHRGRMYPRGANLASPQGDDRQRALLKFSTPAPLGSSEGFQAFKNHGLQMLGDPSVDLESSETLERVRLLCREPKRLPDWRPKDPARWLAFAHEWVRFSEYAAAHDQWPPQDISLVVTFETGLPIEIDQHASTAAHWAALMRDRRGLALTGILGGHEPDLYVHLVDRVLDQLDGPLLEAATRLITRKFIKDAVNSRAGGEPFRSFAERLRGRIIALELPRNIAWPLAREINEVFKEELSFVDSGRAFVRRCASAVAKSGSHFSWFSPAGMPCAQVETETKEQSSFRPRCRIEGVEYRTSFTQRGEKPDSLKHGQKGPANFVQSLDAALMHLALDRIGPWTPLATVHDSVLIRPFDILKVRQSLLDSWVEIYCEADPLKGLWDHCYETWPKCRNHLPDPSVLDRRPLPPEAEEILRSTTFWAI